MLDSSQLKKITATCFIYFHILNPKNTTQADVTSKHPEYEDELSVYKKTGPCVCFLTQTTKLDLCFYFSSRHRNKENVFVVYCHKPWLHDDVESETGETGGRLTDQHSV